MRNQTPSQRYDEIAYKLRTNSRYDSIICGPVRNQQLIARLNRAYDAYLHLNGPVRLFRKVKEIQG